MSTLSTLLGGGGKPVRVTTYSSGSGNFTPLNTSNGFARVTLTGGGAGGAGFAPQAGAGYGGNGGPSVQIYFKTISPSYAYAVGAGGSAGPSYTLQTPVPGGNSVTAPGAAAGNGAATTFGTFLTGGASVGPAGNPHLGILHRRAGFTFAGGIGGGPGFVGANNAQQAAASGKAGFIVDAPYSNDGVYYTAPTGVFQFQGGSIANTSPGLNTGASAGTGYFQLNPPGNYPPSTPNIYGNLNFPYGYGGGGGGSSMFGIGGAGGNAAAPGVAQAGQAAPVWGGGGGGGAYITRSTTASGPPIPDPYVAAYQPIYPTITYQYAAGGAGNSGFITIEEFIF